MGLHVSSSEINFCKDHKQDRQTNFCCSDWDTYTGVNMHNKLTPIYAKIGRICLMAEDIHPKHEDKCKKSKDTIQMLMLPTLQPLYNR